MTVLFGFIGTLILSTLSYRLLESPILRLKDRFTTPRHVEPQHSEIETLQMS
jgi:peptidoglycan/LPS O-acetylase OafA/YrhL